MKIIGVSNFDKDTVNDILVCENITNKLFGNSMLEVLNDRYCSEHSLYFFELVEDDRKLHVWEQ